VEEKFVVASSTGSKLNPRYFGGLESALKSGALGFPSRDVQRSI
jgi:hypothetical protein